MPYAINKIKGFHFMVSYLIQYISGMLINSVKRFILIVDVVVLFLLVVPI